MSDFTIYAQRGITWIEANLQSIVKSAMLQSQKVLWQGMFVYGDHISKGSAVVYTSRVFLAVRDNKDSVPKNDSPDWFMLVDLRTMQFPDGDFQSIGISLPPVDKSSSTRLISSQVARYMLTTVYNKALNEPIAGTHQWRSRFTTEAKYSPGDIVAFRNSVYIATTGDGVPGEGKGWEPLHVTGAVGHGKDMNYLFDGSTGQLLVTEDGEPLVYE
ncbi:MAG: hypothetical protein JRJ45_00615 [Deltaproteobacteria bacterium]|nr:hypothetical protein [Deltaproteobacteria bacterium]